MRINDIDERNGVLKSRISLSLSWTDTLFGWNPLQHNNVTQLHVPPDSHWHPDINVHNTVADPIRHRTDAWTLLRYTGTITSVMFLDVQTKCLLDLQDFPQDKQTCTISLASWLYSSRYLRMEFWKQDKYSIDVKLWEEPGSKPGTSDNPRWELVGGIGRGSIRQVTYSCCPDEPFDQLTVTLTLRRRDTSVTSVFKWHVLVFLILVPSQFLLSHTAGIRSIYGVLLVIGLCMGLPTLYSFLPQGMTSIPTLGCVYIAAILCSAIAVIISTLIASIETRLYCHSVPPKWTMKVCGILQRVLLMAPSQTTETNSATTQPMMENDEDMSPNGQRLHLDEVDTEPNKNIDQYGTTSTLGVRSHNTQQTNSRIVKEWRTIANVLDRLCLLVFFIVFIGHVVFIA